ncbi:hypothetical protein KBX37_08965 [Micromonospora sp. U56]|uniref:hypothetical protein n=1 Tax=Micromonospora sp. U56 TaxID=2824900 RepID=UPI001B39C229|nr:hypothetical protein [Micromonospora sp. U56]MBQ0893225.1 hypothetical protein [Micromonospora sp. U56]
MTKSRDPVSKLHDAAVLWAVGYGSALDVVRAACDALVAGADGPSVAMLAGVSVRQADTELRDLLPAALDELGSPLYAENSEEAEVAALKVLASRALAGDLSSRELADWAHRTFGHDRLPLAEPLAALDDQYDMLGYGPVGPSTAAMAALDIEVLTEARRILESAGSDRGGKD